ncbi:hypothetical protein T484DRAFT_1844335 [Baffinella frigidus]|nr:hypothetical protein T484DRAFT_1844335 [Cryptophyta sp. CCMP2293]
MPAKDEESGRHFPFITAMPRRREEPTPSAEDLANVSAGRPARSVKKPKWLEEDETGGEGGSAVPAGDVAAVPSPVAPPVMAAPEPPVVVTPVKRGPGRPPGSGHKQQHLAAAAALAAQQALAPAAVDQGDGASPYSRRERIPKRPSDDEVGGLKDLIPKSRAGRVPGGGYATPMQVPSSPMRPAAPQARAFPEGGVRPYPLSGPGSMKGREAAADGRPYPLSGPGSMKGRKRQLLDESSYATPPRPTRESAVW